MVPAGPVISNSEPGFLPVTAIEQPVTCQSHCSAALRGGRKTPHHLSPVLEASRASWRGGDGVGRAMRHPSLTWGALATPPPCLKALLLHWYRGSGEARLPSTKKTAFHKGFSSWLITSPVEQPRRYTPTHTDLIPVPSLLVDNTMIRVSSFQSTNTQDAEQGDKH